MGNWEMMEFIERYLLGFIKQRNPIRLRTYLEVNIKKARKALRRCVLCVWPNLEQLLMAACFIFFFHPFNLKQQEEKWSWPIKPWYFAPHDQSWEQHPWAQGAGKCPRCLRCPKYTRVHPVRMLSFVPHFLFQVCSYLHLHQPKQLPKLDGAWARALWLFLLS